ncbi:integrator complex subunit 12 [Arapaima gigas]
MAATVSLELDPIFLKGLGYLHSKSKDSAEKLKALLDESLARGSDSTYRTSQKEMEVTKMSITKVSLSKQELKSSGSSSSGSGSSKSSSSEKSKKESEKRAVEKVKVDLVEGTDPPKKPRVERQENRSSPVTVLTSRDLPIPDLSSFDETSADDFAMEMGLACVVCRQMTVSSGNQLVECQECHNLYHQDCHKPQVTDKDVNDPRLVWYCARCTRQMKRMAQKSQKPAQKPAPSMASVAPVAKDTLVRKSDAKPKQDTTSTFQAFKRTEVKAPGTAAPPGSGSSAPSSSGLTGWAAFGAKASPSCAKVGPSTSGNNGKGASANQKPAGLSGLTSTRSGLGAKIAGGTGCNNSSGAAVPLKPPPPLTLGKPGLTRVSGSDSSKVGATGSSDVSDRDLGLTLDQTSLPEGRGLELEATPTSPHLSDDLSLDTKTRVPLPVLTRVTSDLGSPGSLP